MKLQLAFLLFCSLASLARSESSSLEHDSAPKEDTDDSKSITKRGLFGGNGNAMTYGGAPGGFSSTVGYGNPGLSGYGTNAALGGYGSNPSLSGYSSNTPLGGYGSNPALGGYGSVPTLGGYGSIPTLGAYGSHPVLPGYNSNPLLDGNLGYSSYGGSLRYGRPMGYSGTGYTGIGAPYSGYGGALGGYLGQYNSRTIQYPGHYDSYGSNSGIGVPYTGYGGYGVVGGYKPFNYNSKIPITKNPLVDGYTYPGYSYQTGFPAYSGVLGGF